MGTVQLRMKYFGCIRHECLCMPNRRKTIGKSMENLQNTYEETKAKGVIFKIRFSEAKENLEQKKLKDDEDWLGLKTKLSRKRTSLGVNVESRRTFSQRSNGVFKVGACHLPQKQHSNIVVNRHTVT